MDFVTLQDPRLLEWAQARLSTRWERDQCRWVAGLDAGGIVWVVVYSHFSPRNCTLSIATNGSRRWASRATFRTILGIPFSEWNLPRITFVVAANNERSLAMMRHSGRFSIGAQEEGRMRAFFPGDVDGVVFGLLKKDCRWI